MIYYNNSLCVEAAWLVEQGVMTRESYKHLAQRGGVTVTRRGCKGTPALVDYESMPSRFKEAVVAIVGDPYAVARRNLIADNIAPNMKANATLEAFECADGRHLPADKIRQYYAEAIVLDSILRLRSMRKLRRTYKAKTFWPEVAQACADLDEKRYPHRLPTNGRSLERKCAAYEAEGAESLIHSTYKTGARNAAKVVDANQESTLAVLISDPRKLDDAQVCRLYNSLAAEMSWKEITDATVANWRRKMDGTLFARRNGGAAYQNRRAMQVARRAPSLPLLFWTMDGWDAELLYQERNKKGVTTYTNRATVVVVLDACRKYPIGYAIGTHETPTLIREALRNAAQHTAELFGSRFRTAQLQTDNYAISKMLPLYEQAALTATPAHHGNAKAKIIEPWFRYFNKKYCQMAPNWSGFGVTSRRELQPNMGLLQKGRHSFPDYDGVCAQLASFIEAERAELHDAFVALWDKVPAEDRHPLSDEAYLLAYGDRTERPALLQGTGIKVTIGGRVRTYDCFELEIRDHATERWTVVYDPSDTSRALAVNADATLRFPLEEKYIQPMALAERQDGDFEQLQRVRDYNRAAEERIATRLSAYQQTAEEMLEAQDGKRLEVLQKFLITDSHGQHKDARNDARLETDITPEPVADATPDLPAPRKDRKKRTYEPTMFDASDVLDDM